MRPVLPVHCVNCTVALALLLIAARPLPAAQDTAPSKPTMQALLGAARAAWPTNPAVALIWCGRAITLDRSNAEPYLLRAAIHGARRDHERALRDATSAIRMNSARPTSLRESYQLRGTLNFKALHFKESVRDFDEVLRMSPEQRPYHWQRGISLYYAGDFEEGRKQFELHQTVNPNDVENAVWHFLCVARSRGVEAARASLLKVGPDARVPMSAIYALFAGTGSAEEVTAAAATSRDRGAQFYAHLYLGLYFDALHDARARGHIDKAAKLAGPDYMGDVARVHATLLMEEELGKRPPTWDPRAAGPENAGMRLRLSITPEPAGTCWVRVELMNVINQPIHLVGDWPDDHNDGDYKKYLEADTGFTVEPALMPPMVQVGVSPRNLPQPTYTLVPGETLKLEWRAPGRRLKNESIHTFGTGDPLFPVDGRYSIQASLLLCLKPDAAASASNRLAAALEGTSKDQWADARAHWFKAFEDSRPHGTVRLLSNKQSYSVGGSDEPPKFSFGKIVSVNTNDATARIDVGSRHKIAAGDQFNVYTHFIAHRWRLTITDVEWTAAQGTLEPVDYRGAHSTRPDLKYLIPG